MRQRGTRIEKRAGSFMPPSAAYPRAIGSHSSTSMRGSKRRPTLFRPQRTTFDFQSLKLFAYILPHRVAQILTKMVFDLRSVNGS